LPGEPAHVKRANDAPPFPAGLYAFVDDGIRPEISLVEQARALLAGGVRVIQLRAKHTPMRELLPQVRAVTRACEAARALCLVNDHVDVALLAGAHGVHLGDDDLPPEDARRVLPAGSCVGVTVRNVTGAHLAHQAGADYVGVGPLFTTRTKPVGAPVLGVARFADLVRESPLPVVAIGGIGLDNIAQVAATGAHGAAVLSDLLCAPDIAEQAQRLMTEWCRKGGS
jgi:thiamine-phosphate pyrophosphorylase